jgi:hypothetical protein
MAPPGTRIIAHEKPKQRVSWDPHGVDGWYLGPTAYHYRCYRDHIRIVDTLKFFPAKVAMPRTASKDMATIAAQKLTHALLHPAPAAPFSSIGGAQLEALRQLAMIFDASLPYSAIDFSIPVPLNATNETPAPAFHPPCRSAPVHTATHTAVQDTMFPAHAPPRMGPSHTPSPSPRVSPHLDQSPRVGPSRAPAPRMRPYQAPSPRVIPSQAPLVVPTTPHHLRREPPSPRVRGTPPHRSSPHGHGSTGTNICGDFEDVVEKEDVPPQHRTCSQTAHHNTHAVHAMPMANAVIHPTTGANM